MPVHSTHSLSFNTAVDQHVDTSSAVVNPGAFTWTCWLYLNSLVGLGGLLNKDDAGGNREYFIFVNSGTLQGYVFNTVGGLASASIPTMTAGVWYFVAFTFDGSTVALSVNNGTPDTAAFTGTPNTGSAVLQFGRAQELSTRVLDGSLDDIRFYNRVLSGSELADLYAGNSVTSGLTNYWTLDEGTGTLAADSVGSANGTLVNGPTRSTDVPVPLQGSAFIDSTHNYLQHVAGIAA